MGNPRPGLFGELVAPALAVVCAVAFFIWLAAVAMGGEADGFDTAVRGYVHSTAFPALTYTMRGLTSLGEAVFLVTLGSLIVWRLVITGRHREAAFLAAAALGAEAVDQALKFWYRRQRPEAFFGVAPANYSFPSGHAFVSLCFYLTVAEILIEEEWPRGRRMAARAMAVLLAGLIGLSRVYLGVHYPTDVLAGFAAAVAWLALLRCGKCAFSGRRRA
jgi:undecaprenyl-diphosphatase